MKEKKALRLIYIISALVLLAVVVIYQLPESEDVPEWAFALPKLNATINATCSLFLILSFIMIRRGEVNWHRMLNISTFILSAIFLISYVVYHSFGIETSFPKNNPLRPVYLFVLISHIILAAVVFPLILLSFYRGLIGQVQKHKRVARITMPLWFYVTITGVIVYLMISPYYSFNH